MSPAPGISKAHKTTRLFGGLQVKGVRTTGSVEDILLFCHRFKRKISSERKSAALGYSLGMYVVGGCCRCGRVQRTQRSRMGSQVGSLSEATTLCVERSFEGHSPNPVQSRGS